LTFELTFLWGCAGAFLSYLAIYILPQLRSLLQDENWNFSAKRVAIFIFIALGLIAGGGLFAAIIGDATLPKHAAFYGVGWEAAVKGVYDGSRLFNQGDN
jgi:hypothetical protein